MTFPWQEIVAIIRLVPQSLDNEGVASAVTKCFNAASFDCLAGAFNLFRRYRLFYKIRFLVFVIEWGEQVRCYTLGLSTRQALTRRVERPGYIFLKTRAHSRPLVIAICILNAS